MKIIMMMPDIIRKLNPVRLLWKFRQGTSLQRLAARAGFELGVVVDQKNFKNRHYRWFTEKHFAAVTFANEMKFRSLIDEQASRNSADGLPVLNFKSIDPMAEWAKNNKLHIHGHALIYHMNTPEWFFHENYDESAPAASREVNLQRMECYIDRVIRHFEEKFPGVVNCWDVVNEALGDIPDEYRADDPLHLRISRLGVSNPFMNYIGPDYPMQAFLFARNTVEALKADIRLCLNDFNIHFPDKIPYVLSLARAINEFAYDENQKPRKLLDDICIEGYLGGYGNQKGCLSDSELEKLKNAISEYSRNGFGVQITELTVRNFEAESEAAHIDYYVRLFRMLYETSQTNARLKNITIWGLTDSPISTEEYRYQWNPYGGLLNINLDHKPVFERLRREMKTWTGK